MEGPLNQSSSQALTETDLINIDYQELLKIYRNWKASESIIISKTKDLKALTLKYNNIHELNIQYQGRIKALESVKDITLTFQNQLTQLKNENESLKAQNNELLAATKDLENILNSKLGDDNTQVEQLTHIHSEFSLLSERYKSLEHNNLHIENILAKEKANTRAYETQIIVLENKISTLIDENYRYKSQLETSHNRLAQCDKELAHASNQLYNLSLEMTNIHNKKEEIVTNTWEIELLKTDISRLLKLIEHIPSLSEFLYKWQDSIRLSYMDEPTTTAGDTPATTNNDNYLESLYDSNKGISYFPNSGEYNEEYYASAWEEAGFSSSAELSHIRRMHGRENHQRNITTPNNLEVSML